MGRPPLPVGTYGKILVTADGDGYRARASFRDFDGKRREVSRWGSSENRATLLLKEALTDRSGAGRSGEIRPDTKFAALKTAWLADIEAGSLASNTQETYQGAVKLYVAPALDELRLREIDVVAVNRVLASVRALHGPGAAKTARSVLSSILGSAVHAGALSSNPVRDAKRIEQPRKERPKSLTREEAKTLMAKLRADEWAVEHDVPDLVEWMLGTGVRIGEACAVRRDVLGDDTVEINATMVRIKGQGLRIQKWTKTDAGWRRLALPAHLVAMLERRARQPKLRRPEGVVFTSPRGQLRDPSNTAGDIRAALDAAGFEWVVPHTFRKTVATWMDDEGCPARMIADQLGQARPSITQDVYMGRRVVSADAARILALT